MWGSSVRDYEIECDGRTIPITVNLHQALHRVRQPYSERILWADSVCINQDDKREQGHQVALMGRIYQSARRALICVGPDESPGGQDGRDVVSLLKDVDGMIERVMKGLDLSPDSFPFPDRRDPLLSDPR